MEPDDAIPTSPIAGGGLTPTHMIVAPMWAEVPCDEHGTTETMMGLGFRIEDGVLWWLPLNLALQVVSKMMLAYQTAAYYVAHGAKLTVGEGEVSLDDIYKRPGD